MFNTAVRRTFLAILGALVLEAALLVGIFSYLPKESVNTTLPTKSTTNDNSVVNTAINSSSPVGSDIIADMVDKTSPAVVKVETVTKNDNSYDPFFNDPFYQEFFGFQSPYRSQPNISSGMGSGFIISADGYILTNEHVISGASEIHITLSDKEEPLPAKVIGSDTELDLAVLKIDATKLPFLELGNDDDIRVGNWVVAIGNPYGLDHTVTTGVISAKSRPVQVEDRQYKNLLQTDASINPGNSGGPLLNLAGQVIGINTAVNASAQGIGFAIPVNTVKAVLDTLITDGKVSRPWMGVYIQTLDAELAQQLGLENTEGAVLSGIVEKSPAAKAGLKQGDAVISINKQKITDASDITGYIEKCKVGDKVTLLIERAGDQQYITVTLEEK